MPKGLGSYDIVVCGSATVDVFADTESELISIKTLQGEEKLIAYHTGCKILINDLLFQTGGGGTNTSVAFSKLGLKTGYLGSLGDDENGRRVIAELNQENIDFLGHTVHQQTGYSVVLDSVAHDRTILTYKGANNYLSYKKICKDCFSTNCFYFSSMMGNSFKTLQKIAQYAKRNKIPIAFNPSEYQVKQGYKNLKPILDNTHILTFNRDEAQLLTKETHIEQILKSIKKMGIPIVCITDGPRITYAFDGTHIYELKPNKIRVIESTGAGDAFGAGFVTGYMKKKDISWALKIGMANAESVITHHGAKSKLLSYAKASKKTPKFKVKKRKF